MKLSTKVLIYSAVIFPGAGYFIIQHTKTAYAFTLVAASFWVFIIYDSMIKARIMADQLVQQLSHNGVIDTQQLTQSLLTLPAYIREQMLIIEGPLPAGLIVGCSIALGITWLLGMAGSYYHAKQRELNLRPA